MRNEKYFLEKKKKEQIIFSDKFQCFLTESGVICGGVRLGDH